ncbi:MAG: MmcQ/YjbR family DNA-binding protein [Akkermansiaceae bacterium]
MSPPKLVDLLLSLPNVEESEPFGPGVFVQKVGGKMFALYSDDDDGLRLNLKCDPDRAIELREKHESITPGYHMNKKHWNTLILDGSLPADLVKELIQHSYDLVFTSLSKKAREALP